jgi:hypothetical protein
MIKKALMLALPFLAVLVGAPTPSQASDHVDGVKTGIDIAADITDVFTFVSPQNPNKLVLIMNVHGLAFSRSRFSNAVDYKFRIRPIEDAKTLTPSADPKKEQTVTCSFSGGLLLIDPLQHATCKVNFGSTSETVAFDTRSPQFQAGGVGEHGGVKVFAGVRSDSWFLDLKKTVQYVEGKKVPNSAGSNGLKGQNILSIAVELDKNRLNGPLLAVTAQTVRK